MNRKDARQKLDVEKQDVIQTSGLQKFIDVVCNDLFSVMLYIMLVNLVYVVWNYFN
jgi:hypothetical protein